MSRAFVKEPDGDAVGDDAPELPVSSHPNLMTQRGLAVLHAELDSLNVKRQSLLDQNDPVATQIEVFAIDRRRRYLLARIESALVQLPENQSPDQVGFGATVRVVDEDDCESTFTIVGEDEANPAQGLISWTSPIARNLMERKVSESVTWRRPKGDTVLEILSIDFEM